MSMKNNRLINGSTIGTAKVIVDILPKGYGIPNVKINPTSITVHNTDNWDSTARNNHKYMSNINRSGERKASWHFTVDDIEIYQAQSTNYKCLHSGTSSGNNTSIGIEICQFKDKNKQLKAYKNAIELIKILLSYHNFGIDKVVQHNKWSGKNCPSVLRANTYGYGWNWFIEQCKGKSNNETLKYRIVTGGFKKELATENMEHLKSLTGWWMTTQEQNDGSYCIVTGGFDKDRAEAKLKALRELTGWWATIELEK